MLSLSKADNASTVAALLGQAKNALQGSRSIPRSVAALVIPDAAPTGLRRLSTERPTCARLGCGI